MVFAPKSLPASFAATVLLMVVLFCSPGGAAPDASVPNPHASGLAIPAGKHAELKRLWSVFKGGRVVFDHRVGRKITFTFDDGPSHRVTPLVLRQLKKLSIRGAFFVVARRFAGRSSIAAKNRRVLREVARQGHYVGNHTFTHPMMAQLGTGRQRWQIEATENNILAVTGLRTYLYRPPFGGQTGYSIRLLKKRGYATVMWNLSTGDPFDRHVAKVHRNVMRKINRHRGGIVLMHDTNAWSAMALPLIVRSILVESCKLLYRREEPYVVVGLEHFLVPESGKVPKPGKAALEQAARWRARTVRLCGRKGAPSATRPVSAGRDVRTRKTDRRPR